MPCRASVSRVLQTTRIPTSLANPFHVCRASFSSSSRHRRLISFLCAHCPTTRLLFASLFLSCKGGSVLQSLVMRAEFVPQKSLLWYQQGPSRQGSIHNSPSCSEELNEPPKRHMEDDIVAAKVTFVNQNDKSKSFKVNLFGPETNRVRVASVLGVFKASMAIMEDGNVMEAGNDGLSIDTFVAGGTYNLSVYPVNIIPQGPCALAVLEKQDPMKRMIADISALEHFPGIDELDLFLKTNPLQSGFPISSKYYRRLAPFDVKELFKMEDSYRLCKKLDSYLAKVLEPASTGSTEESFHQFWDELVNDFVQPFCDEAVYRDRNTSRDPSTGNLRPDVIGLVGTEWALWRGEEESLTSAGDPKQELLDKLTWIYGQIPYILAYYARGTMVTLAALYMVEGTKKFRKSCSFNLSTLDGRVNVILACLNVARLLPCLSSLCEDYSVEAEFKILPERGGKQVKLYGSSVKKSYQSKGVFDRVVEMYDRIRGCPNTERFVSSFPKDGAESQWHSIVFQPRCSGLQRARPESELVKALLCVAKAVVWLHKRSIMHRDIRWANIGHFQEEWFLLDFDEACISPQLEAHRSMCPKNHAPETCTGGHDCSVDIWGIGHLIKTSKIFGLAPKLIELQNCCLDRNPSLRPSASYCYEELSSLIRDGLV